MIFKGSKLLICCLLVLAGLPVSAQESNQSQQSHLIPLPVLVQPGLGKFQITSKTSIVLSPEDAAHAGIADFLAQRLRLPTGFAIPVQYRRTKNHDIRFSLNKVPQQNLGTEGYTLQVSPKGILISANQPKGWFYAMQTLSQLLPPHVESSVKINTISWSVPCIKIEDCPRFEWRGLMLDVSRHFFSKDFIKAYIDQMVKYKFNTLHLHLTDDHGWRMEIKGLPELTKVGAWRVPREGFWKDFEKPQAGEANTYGGFYTANDMREIIDYASQRFLTIVPEIDVPAHSMALIASYPNLSCKQLQYTVNPGLAWSAEQENVLCAGNDSVFLSLDKIFTEIALIFPGKYIHIGGDEAVKTFWARCPKCQQRMRDEHLSNTEELQSYFIKRVAKIIESKGKKLIGWDEILEGGLAADATVMSWRGMDGGLQAAKAGHKVIMSPWQNAYLDLYQSDPVMENNMGAVCRLSSCYQFEPVPEGTDPKYILGAQGILWTEHVPNERQAQYMTWPRAMALAEVFWSAKTQRNWNGFINRLEWHLPRLDTANVKYSRGFYDPLITAVKTNTGELKVKLATEIEGLDIYYTFDDTHPDNYYPRYTGQLLTLPKGAHSIRVITYRAGKPMGREINLPLKYLANRVERSAN
ncbi:MAG: beta-N-acetylhexosaminidase [Mucilaginibacter sp.]|nr:beta-N-acetylhexosaminidase [Mucilaginibacter sp.]